MCPQPSPVALSVAIVCRNNADTIGRTLDSVAGLASEIVAVDSGSEDGTLELLERAGARVERTEWKGHVATKQMTLELCAQPWVLCLDSDESLEPELAASIRRTIERDDRAAAAWQLNRKVWMHGRPLNFAWQPEWRTRLVRRELVPDAIAWGGTDPHDQLRVDRSRAGRIERLSGTLRHDTAPDFAAFLESQVRLARVAARSLAASGHRGSYRRLLFSPPGALARQLILRRAWRDGWRGWCAAGATAAATLMKHVILLDLARRERRHPAGADPGGSKPGASTREPHA